MYGAPGRQESEPPTLDLYHEQEARDSVSPRTPTTLRCRNKMMVGQEASGRYVSGWNGGLGVGSEGGGTVLADWAGVH